MAKKKDSKEKDLSGLQKSAVLLVSLDTGNAAKILSNLDTETVEKISMEIARMDEIPQETRDRVLEEYHQTMLASRYIEQGGIQYAQTLLEQSLNQEEASRIIGDLQETIQQTPFHFLLKAEPENILTFIQDEHPQTISLILAHLQPGQAASVLSGLSPKIQIEVIKRIAKMEQTTPEAIREVERSLEVRLSSIVNQEFEEVGGFDSVAEMLNLTDRSTEKGILENMEEEDPDLVEEIRRRMFVFEDIILVNDKGIQQVLREVDNDELGLALKTASDELKTKIFNNMSERAAETTKENMEFMGPVRVADVEAAQQKIVDIVRRLEEAGDIIIQGKGGDDEVVV